MTRKFFRSDGTYVAFERVGRVFRPDGSYLGWIDSDGVKVWEAAGTYLGDIVEDNYIFRNTEAVAPVARTPRIDPVPPIPPVRPPNREPRARRAAWRDAL